MIDIEDSGPAESNLRTLIYFLGEKIDHKLAELRKATPYKGVRASDIRVFVTAARGENSISDVARKLGISRQSAQASVKRLIKLGVVELELVAKNKREKHILITPRGVLAGKTAKHQIEDVESDIAAIIGRDNVEQMRSHLVKLVSNKF